MEEQHLPQVQSREEPPPAPLPAPARLSGGEVLPEAWHHQSDVQYRLSPWWLLLVEKLLLHLSGPSGFKLKLWRLADFDAHGPGLVVLGTVALIVIGLVLLALLL